MNSIALESFIDRCDELMLPATEGFGSKIVELFKRFKEFFIKLFRRIKKWILEKNRTFGLYR